MEVIQEMLNKHSVSTTKQMYTYKLVIAYDGTPFCGWLVQNNATSVQVVLCQALEKMLGIYTPLPGSGRTDAGVHALGQVAHFKVHKEINPHTFLKGLNALTPDEISILSVEKVEDDFHARYSAKGKLYRYSLCPHPVQSPFRKRYALHFPFGLDKALMKQALLSFVGTHDFCSLANKHGSAKDSIRTIFRADFIEDIEEWHLEFEGNGFLYKMVRNMVGLVLEVGMKKRASSDIPAILDAKDRRAAGMAAPAHGLYLMKVLY